MSERLLRGYPYALAGSACVGLAAANAVRVAGAVVVALAVGLAAGAAFAGEFVVRVALLAAALGLAGWWWGSARLDALDASALVPHVGEAEQALIEVTGPARRSSFAMRVPGKALRFGSFALHEPVLLELPLGRSPPQGARLELRGRVRQPRPASHGFDERKWLRRHGVHVIVEARDWQVAGRRGGVGGYADRVRGWLAGSMAPGLGGERRAVLEGIVLGEDEGLSDELQTSFRSSGLYHLLRK